MTIPTTSPFTPTHTSSFRLLHQTGPTHHTQKSIQIQCEAKIAKILENAREKLFGGDCDEELILLYNGSFGAYEPLETQQQLESLIRRYKKLIPTLKVEFAKDVKMAETYDMSTEDLYRKILQRIAEDKSDANDAEQAQRILQNEEETKRIFGLYLNSCRYNVPDKLERHTYNIWYKSIEQYVKSVLMHKRIETRGGNDRAVFGSSFTLKQISDDLPSTLSANVSSVDDNRILAGPVMGSLTPEGTLRFSAVLSGSAQRDREMFCSLVPANQNSTSQVKTFPIKLREAPGVPHTMEVNNLLQSTPYVTIWTGIFNGDEKVAQFDTFPSSLVNFKAVAISNSMISDKNRALWKEVDHENPRYTVHLGGLINGDEAWEAAHKVLDSYKQDTFTNASVSIEDRNAVRECYRALYRQQWSEKSVQKALSKRPNLFSFSDAEVCQGFGSSPQDAQRGTRAFFIAEQARYVYWEYQRDLNESVFSQYYEDTFSTHEAHHFQIHDTAVVTLDTVTARTYLTALGKEDGRSVLGADQWNFLENVFGRDLSRAGTKLLVLSVDASFLSAASNEATQLLSLVHQWKKSDPSRLVVIVSAARNGSGAEYALSSGVSGEFASWVITSASGDRGASFAPSVDFGNGLYTAQKRTQVGDKANFAVLQRQQGNVGIKLIS